MTTRQAMGCGLAVALAAAGWLVAAPDAPVAATADIQKTEITASRLEFDYQKMHATFTSNVVVKDVSMNLESDYLWVTMDQVSQQITLARATGHVKITEKDRIATSDQAEYNAREGKLVLTGNAMVKRGREVLRGRKITFWRGDNRVECEQPIMVLFPEKGKGLQGMME